MARGDGSGIGAVGTPRRVGRQGGRTGQNTHREIGRLNDSLRRQHRVAVSVRMNSENCAAGKGKNRVHRTELSDPQAYATPSSALRPRRGASRRARSSEARGCTLGVSGRRGETKRDGGMFRRCGKLHRNTSCRALAVCYSSDRTFTECALGADPMAARCPSIASERSVSPTYASIFSRSDTAHDVSVVPTVTYKRILCCGGLRDHPPSRTYPPASVRHAFAQQPSNMTESMLMSASAR